MVACRRCRSLRILVIEDESRILAFLVRGLEAEGYAVDAAETGAGGLHQALREAYDLVILDLLLPGLDGLSVLRELARNRPELPVLILSARRDLATGSAASSWAHATIWPSRSRSTSSSHVSVCSSSR